MIPLPVALTSVLPGAVVIGAVNGEPVVGLDALALCFVALCARWALCGLWALRATCVLCCGAVGVLSPAPPVPAAAVAGTASRLQASAMTA